MIKAAREEVGEVKAADLQTTLWRTHTHTHNKYKDSGGTFRLGGLAFNKHHQSHSQPPAGKLWLHAASLYIYICVRLHAYLDAEQ